LGEDFYCEFNKVTRSGDTVRWNGKCNFSENGYEPSTVTAQLRGGNCIIAFRVWAGTVPSIAASKMTI